MRHHLPPFLHHADATRDANREFTGKHADIVGLLNQTFAKESLWADGHRQEISKSLQEATAVDASAISKAVDRSIFVVQPVTDKVIATQQATADRFFKLGLIPKAINVRDIVWTWTPGS